MERLAMDEEEGVVRMKAFDLYPHKCHICGKKFECGNDWVFKEGYRKQKYTWFCSYHCIREHQRKEADKRGKRSNKPA